MDYMHRLYFTPVIINYVRSIKPVTQYKCLGQMDAAVWTPLLGREGYLDAAVWTSKKKKERILHRYIFNKKL